MIRNKSKLLPLFVYTLIIVGIVLLSISTYGFPSSFTRGLEAVQVENLDYGLNIPSFNGVCLYSYHDGEKLLNKFSKDDSYKITLRKSYTDDPKCYGKIIGSNLIQGELYNNLENNQWIDLQVTIRQGIPTWSQEPIFILFILMINVCFLLTLKSKKFILLGFIIFIAYSMMTFNGYNRYMNGVDRIVLNQMHIQNIIIQLNSQ
jgi:hypothetical protein